MQRTSTMIQTVQDAEGFIGKSKSKKVTINEKSKSKSVRKSRSNSKN